MQYGLNVADFGAVGDDQTDTLPAVKAALGTLKTQFGAARLFFPSGKFFFTDTLNIHLPVRVSGSNSGASPSGTILRFPPNKSGIVFHEHRTTDDGGGDPIADSGLGDAGGSGVDNIAVWGGMAQSVAGPYTNPAATDPSAHGIWVRCVGVRLRNVWTGFFSGNGVTDEATSGASGPAAGNANNFVFDNVWGQYNQGFGVSLFGSDANAGLITGCSAISNGAGGFQEYSFLGNTWIMCHARDNGLVDPNLGNAPVAACNHNGVSYYVAAGRHGDASTTEPGTDSSVWVPATFVAPKAWAPGLTWATGGSYVSNPANQGNSRALFLGCYQELGQPPAQFTNPVLVVGGNMGLNGVRGSGVFVDGVGGPTFGSNCGFSVGGKTGYGVDYGREDATRIFNLNQPSGHNVQWQISPNLWGGDQVLNLTVENALTALSIFLANSHDPGLVVTRNFRPGPNTSCRIGFITNLAELLVLCGGQMAGKGDAYIFTSPVPGGHLGMICTIPGPIGNGAVFNYFGTVSSEQVT